MLTDLDISPDSGRGSRRRWWALVGASLAVFMAALDGNVVSVALPVMAKQFHVTASIRWVILSYLLPTTALLGVFGALSDVVGRKRVTLGGMILFVAGSILCGTAHSLPQMIIYRIVQGIGASCIASAIIAIATINFAPEERGKAMAVIGLVAPLGGVVGPSVGGVLIGLFGWPAVFFINVPVGIVAFALVARLLPADQPRGIRSFDFAGAALFTIALLLLLLGLSPEAGRLTPRDFVLLAASAAIVGALVAVERRAHSPIVPIRLLARARFWIPLSGILTFPFVGAGLGFIFPFYLEGTLRLSPEQSGLTLLFFPLAMATASQIGGRLSDRFHPRLPAAIGAAISLAGVLLLLPLDAHWSPVGVALRLAITGLGAGFFVAPSSVAVMNAAPRNQVGVAGALVNTARYLGFSLGPTVASVFWSPGLSARAGLAAMRSVVLILAVVQVATLATVLAYRARSGEANAESEVETTVGAVG